MLKFLPIPSVAAFCLFVAGCQPAEQGAQKVAVPVENAPVNAVSESAAMETLANPDFALPMVSIENLSDALLKAEAAFTAGKYERGTADESGAFEWYLAILRFDANHVKAKAGLDKTVASMIAITRQAVREGKLNEASRLLQNLISGLGEQPEMSNLAAELEQSKQAEIWFRKALAFEEANIILATDKAGNGNHENHAVAAYRKALEVFPDFMPAQWAIDRLRSQRERAALNLVKQSKFDAALIALKQAESIDASNPAYQLISDHVYGRLNQAIREKTVLANLALDGLRIKPAKQYLGQAKQISATHPEVIALATRIDDVVHYGRYKARQVFSDAWAMSTPAPEMIVIRYGQFEMGAHVNTVSAPPAQLPRHPVTFGRGFAIARHEITVAQFRQFIESSAHQTRADSRGWSLVFDEKGGSMTKRDNVDWRHDHLGRLAKDDLPVVHVNLQDAKAYAKWLSVKTGQRYRLPSEAEFEYVLRADRDTIYPWGNEAPKKVVANLAGAGDKSTQSRSWGNAIAGYRDFHWGAAPVSIFPEEPWGTYDISGNVEEWVEDCWHDSYQRAPTDGTAWVNPGCTMGVTRGASWASSLNEASIGFRASTLIKTHNARIGFRVVRVL